MTVQDYPDFQTPQAHATAIASTGVPLLRGTNNMGFSTAEAIAGGGDVVLLPQTAVGQPGYEIALTSWMAAASGTMPFLRVAVLWYDASTGLVSHRRDTIAAAGNGAISTLGYYMHGPMYGDLVALEVVNLDPAVTQNIQWTINETSHLYDRHYAQQYAYQATAPNGYNNPLGVPNTGVIAARSPTIAVSSSVSYLCALYYGDVIIDIDNSAGAAALQVELQDAAGWATGTVGKVMYNQSVAAGSTMVQPLTLPATPVNLVLTNASAVSAITPTVVITGQQH